MKKLIALILALICIVSLNACSASVGDHSSFQADITNTSYKVKISDDYPIENTLASIYRAGEQVTVKLCTVTESYYRVYVNGIEQEKDRDLSDDFYTYFTFTMPGEDVLIKIEEVWVDIPDTPQE